MKKFMCSLFLGLALVCFSGFFAWSAQLSVQVKEGKLMEQPSFFSRLLKKIPYGRKVESLEERSGWHRLEKPRGWMHSSALTEQTVSLNPGQADAKITPDKEELALAGKGFNKEVEAKYRAQGRGDYKQVDKMEARFNFTQKELADFLAKGGAKPGEAK